MTWRRDPVEKPHCFTRFDNTKRECEICFVATRCNDEVNFEEEDGE